MKKITRLATVTLALLLITSCAGMPISSMWKLSKLDLDVLNTNPATMRIIVITHKTIQFDDSTINFTLGFSSNDPATSTINTVKGTIVSDTPLPQIAATKKAYEKATLFYLNEEAASSIRRTQNEIKVFKQQGVEGKGMLQINIANAGCLLTAKPSEPLLASIYVKFNHSTNYILMQRNIDLLKVAKRANQDEDIWFKCEPK